MYFFFFPYVFLGLFHAILNCSLHSLPDTLLVWSECRCVTDGLKLLMQALILLFFFLHKNTLLLNSF